MKYSPTPLILLLALLPLASYGQQPADSLLLELQNISAYEEASALQAKLNGKMGIGSHIGLSSRETPGIVSVITAQEIEAIGARDFIDVMRLVPGFDFASDIDFAVGPTIRGNWAMEGKMLLMIDGIKYNELLFQTLIFGNHLPVDQIERVEVIRGPGSAIYGGTAEYGVINIITKGADGLNGISATTSVGMYGEDLARKTVGISAGKQLGDVALDFTAHTGENIRSNASYTPMFNGFSGPVDLAKGRGRTAPTFISAGVKWQGLSARVLFDDYDWTSYYYDIENKMLSGLLQYEMKLGDKLTLTPQISYTNQTPWHYKRSLYREEDYGFDYKIKAERATTTLTAGYRANHRVYLTAGIEWYQEQAKDMLDGGNFGDVDQVRYQNYAAYGEVLMKHRIANFTAGGRIDHHSSFGSAWAPRFAVTKHVNRWHFKGLASGAYRAPGIENINLSENIKPERTTTFELEAGYQFTKDMLLSANLFKLDTRDVIVYTSSGLNEEGYRNFERVGSKGVELSYQIRRPSWFANMTYSYSKASDKNTVDTYKVEGNDHLNVGIAASKATLQAGYKITSDFSINPSLVRIGERYGYATANELEVPQLRRFAPLHLANIHLQYKNLLPGLTVGLGVHNLLDEENSFIQAYNGESAPVPGPGREFVAKASYNLTFKK